MNRFYLPRFFFHFSDLDCEIDLVDDNPSNFPQPLSIKQEKICGILSNSIESAKMADTRIKGETSTNNEEEKKVQSDKNVNNFSR
jgi:hypothetical protein